MPAALDLRSLDAPVAQAGMGSIARHELAAAVSEAGGLGTIGGVRAPIAAEIGAARGLTGRPIAVNLLLPFARPGDAEAAAAADAIVTFWGKPCRLAANAWIHQCGSVEEAKAAAAGNVTLTCSSATPNARLTVNGPGTIALTTTIGNLSFAANTFIVAPFPIDTGVSFNANAGAGNSETQFLQSGSTLYELKFLLSAQNSGPVQWDVVGDAIPVS